MTIKTSLIALCFLFAIGWAVSEAQDAKPSLIKAKKNSTAVVYEGISDKGDLNLAVQVAVDKALADQRGADRLIEWELQTVSGRKGGIKGTNEIHVAIRLK